MQVSFGKSLTLSVLALASVQQAQAYVVMDAFKNSGKHAYSVHGVLRDLVVKKALHTFVKEHLPNSHFFSLSNTSFDLHDVFNALSDAVAEIVDGHVFKGDANYVGEARMALAGSFAHKLWEALLDITGVSARFDDEIKDNYDKYGKAWFSRAFAICLNDAFDQTVAHFSSN